jgi:hypothetical protein
MKKWVFEYLSRASNIQATILAVTCLHPWDARSGARNDLGLLHPSRVAVKIKVYTDNIVLHCYKNDSGNRCDSSACPRWIPPPPGLVCVNVDAALFTDDNRMGWGAVGRDHRGTLKFSVSEGITCISSPEVAEAIAIRSALTFALNNGFMDIILASDCLSMIQHMCSPVLDRSPVGALVTDIKTLAVGFNKYSFKHYGHKINVAAHILAHNCENSVCNFSFDVIPECIREILCNDVK